MFFKNILFTKSTSTLQCTKCPEFLMQVLNVGRIIFGDTWLILPITKFTDLPIFPVYLLVMNFASDDLTYPWHAGYSIVNFLKMCYTNFVVTSDNKDCDSLL